MNVVLAANPRRKRRRKPKQKTKKRAGHKRPTQKRPVQAKKRRTAKRKKTTAARKRPARKTEKRTMARKRRKSGSRRKRSGGKRRMTKKQRAAALRNLAKGRRKRARKSGSISPRRRRRRAAAKAPTTRRRRRVSRKGRKHTKWKTIKPYRRKSTVGGHRRRTNPGALMTAGLAAVGVGAGVLASKAADKFLPATLSPQLKSWIKAGAALAGGVGGAMLSPALGIGFGASLGGKALDEVSDQIMSPPQVTGLGRIYQQLPSHDTQLEAIVPEGTSFGAVFDSSVDLDELAFEEAG